MATKRSQKILSYHLSYLRNFTTSMSSRRCESSDVVVVGAARTPIGSFECSLSSMPAFELGAAAMLAAIERSGIAKDQVQEVFMGNVIQAGVGRAPARKAAMFADLPSSTICTTINKVCASGMKAIMLGAQSLICGHQNIVVAGGMESISNVPEILRDGIMLDGLLDAYDRIEMGDGAENTAEIMNITKEEQDDYTLRSYERSKEAYTSGAILEELTPITVDHDERMLAVTFSKDEEYKRLDSKKYSSPATLFEKQDGTVTAFNASTLGDGAAACVLTTADIANKMNLKPLARIVGFEDGATNPIDYPLAPSLAISKLMKKNNVSVDDVHLWEINEAFSVVALANIKKLNLDSSKVNVHGGAVSLGHPLGMSGARIVIHLIYALKTGQRGIAAICNAGGGASAILIEKL